MNRLAPYAKAFAAAAVAAATYIVGTGGNVSDLVWWAGLVVFVGASFGIVYAVPNKG